MAKDVPCHVTYPRVNPGLPRPCPNRAPTVPPLAAECRRLPPIVHPCAHPRCTMTMRPSPMHHDHAPILEFYYNLIYIGSMASLVCSRMTRFCPRRPFYPPPWVPLPMAICPDSRAPPPTPRENPRIIILMFDLGLPVATSTGMTSSVYRLPPRRV